MNVFAEWICDLLAQVKTPESVRMVENCGRHCAKRAGTVELMRILRAEAEGLESRTELLEFLAEKTPIRFEAEEDGFITHLDNYECNCKMIPELSRNPEVLCNCTKGYQVAMWEEFFGKPVEVEIIDTILRGGRECVFRVRV